MIDRDKIEKGFRKWCYQSYLPNDHEPIYSAKTLANYFFGESEYQTRKLLKELEAMGYVMKDYEGGIDEEGYPHCYHGWNLTVKALETEIGKEEEKNANCYIENWLHSGCKEEE